MASGYRPRIADAELRACLGSAGAVVIEGPKACGKTRLAQQLAASTVLLDAWQVEPALWNQVRRAVNAVEAPEQLLLTGAGRFTFLRLRPMSLVESGAAGG